MIVGIMTVDLFIPESTSLKVKRSAVKSLKDRIRNRFNVSVSELDHNDKWQRTTLGVAVISNEGRHIESIMDSVLKLVYGDARVEVIGKTIQFV